MEYNNMDSSLLHAQIEKELKEIIQITGVIHSKLEEINKMTKPNGHHTMALMEALKSMDTLSKITGVHNIQLPTNILESDTPHLQSNKIDID